MLRLCLVSLTLCSAAAVAGPALTDPRPLDPADAPQPTHASMRGLSRPHRAGAVIDERPPSPAPSGAVVVGRGGPLFMYDDLENLALEPQVLQGQTGNAIWNDAAITGAGRWLGTTVATRRAFAVDTAVGGSTTKKARLMATTAASPDLFFFGLRYEALLENDPLTRARLFPTADQPARVEHEMYITSLSTMWTSEPIYVTSGFIVSRLLWGGTCVVGCSDIGLPTGPLPYVYTVGFYSPWGTPFATCAWINTAPIGEQVDHDVVMATGRWVRVRHETNTNGEVKAFLDFNDGTGFHLILEEQYVTGFSIDSLGANGSYEVANSPAYYDNILFQGELLTLPQHPQPLACGPSGYADDIQWLNAGPLRDQSPLWYDALSSRANVDVSLGDKLLRQTNIFSDNKHREEFTRTMPTVVATPDHPWTFCEETRVSSSNVTPRAVSLVSFLDNSYVTRVALGHWDPNAANPYTGRFFVQHNAAYNPTDDEDTADPFLPGPQGNGAIARIGGAATIGDPNFDYFDSGVSVPNNQPRILCIGVSHDDSMTVTYAGVDVSGGASGVSIDAFVHSLDEVRHESENLFEGNGDSFYVDDLFLDCVDADCDCEIPSLTLPYVDDLEWAIAGDNIDAHDDDGNPSTPFRWSAAPQMPVISLAGKSKVLQMENLHRDVPQVPGDFAMTVQASTLLPFLEPSSGRSYAAGGSFKLTDGDTTRAWVLAETGSTPGVFYPSAWLLYSAGTGTFWTLMPDPLDPIGGPPTWGDTGRTLADTGVAMHQWFSLVIHRALNGTFIYRINGLALTDSAGEVVRTAPLQSASAGVHESLGAMLLLSGDDLGANPGSILYSDLIRAWALPCAGDTDDDGVVGFGDINSILSAFNSNVPSNSFPNVAPDADGDGIADDDVVGFADLNAALGQFNISCD